MQYQLISQVLLTTAGAVSVQNNILQAVHLRQGSADGACGAYSVMMTLLILGQLEYDAITALNPVDRRKRAGRFQTGLEKFPGLLQQGMDIGEMSKLLHSFNRVLATIEEQQPEQCWQFILDHLRQDHPVIINMQGQDYGHWMVVVGTESNAKGQVTRLLALDSSVEGSDICPWNAFITPRRSRKPGMSHEWHSGGSSCHGYIEQALAVWQRK